MKQTGQNKKSFFSCFLISFPLFLGFLSPGVSYGESYSPPKGKILNICLPDIPHIFTNLVSLNVYDSYATDFLFRRLLKPDIEGRPQYDLTKNIQISSDDLTYTFFLKEGIGFNPTRTFTPKRPFEAKDVVFTFDRLMDKNNPFHDVSGGRYSLFYLYHLDQIIKDVTALDSMRVRFTLRRPSPSFLTALENIPIYSEEYGRWLQQKNKVSEIDIDPSGTGAFYRPLSRKGKVYFTRAPKDQTLPFNGLVLTAVQEEGSRARMVESGRCDIAPLTDSASIERLSRNASLKVITFPSFALSYLAFNVKGRTLADPNVRAALKDVLPLEELIRKVYGTTAEPMSSLFVTDPAAAAPRPADNTEGFKKARNYLMSLNFSPQNPLQLILLAPSTPRPYAPQPVLLAQAVALYWESLGMVKVHLRTLPFQSFMEEIRNTASYDAAILGWMGGNTLPQSYYDPLLHCNSPTNHTGFCSKSFDFLLEDLEKANLTDLAQADIVEEINKILAQHTPIVPLANIRQVFALRKNLPINFHVYPSGQIDLGLQEKNMN